MRWKRVPVASDRGLAIVKTAIVSIEYDANTASCSRPCSAPTLGRAAIQPAGQRRPGIQSAGENGGAAGIMGWAWPPG